MKIISESVLQKFLRSSYAFLKSKLGREEIPKLSQMFEDLAIEYIGSKGLIFEQGVSKSSIIKFIKEDLLNQQHQTSST